MRTSIGLVPRAQLDEEIKSAILKLGPAVVRVVYSFRPDSTGEPSIFFRITLTDSAANEEGIADVTDRIATIIIDEVQPIENWGVHPYFNYRSQSDEQRRPDPEW